MRHIWSPVSGSSGFVSVWGVAKRKAPERSRRPNMVCCPCCSDDQDCFCATVSWNGSGSAYYKAPLVLRMNFTGLKEESQISKMINWVGFNSLIKLNIHRKTVQQSLFSTLPLSISFSTDESSDTMQRPNGRWFDSHNMVIVFNMCSVCLVCSTRFFR